MYWDARLIWLHECYSSFSWGLSHNRISHFSQLSSLLFISYLHPQKRFWSSNWQNCEWREKNHQNSNVLIHSLLSSIWPILYHLTCLARSPHFTKYLVMWCIHLCISLHQDHRVLSILNAIIFSGPGIIASSIMSFQGVW